MRDLTIVCNNAGTGEVGIAALIKARQGAQAHLLLSALAPIRTVIESRLRKAGAIELELVPQGTLSERMRAGGAGIGGFFTRAGADTKLAEGKELREIDGKPYVLETAAEGRFRADQGAIAPIAGAISSIASRRATSIR